MGLDGLTLRRLATELGISAPTLYWHVKDKRELLDLMSEEMVRTAREKMPPFPHDLAWDEKIAEGMRRQYGAIIAYRDGARVVAGNRPTEASLPQIEQFLKLWVEAGFPPNEALAYILSLRRFHHRLRARAPGGNRAAARAAGRRVGRAVEAARSLPDAPGGVATRGAGARSRRAGRQQQFRARARGC